VNHRVLERTLRPLVFRRACLSERRFLLGAELQTWRAVFVDGAPKARGLLRELDCARGAAGELITKLDLRSGRSTR
jgi:hypothetical protein